MRMAPDWRTLRAGFRRFLVGRIARVSRIFLRLIAVIARRFRGRGGCFVSFACHSRFIFIINLLGLIGCVVRRFPIPRRAGGRFLCAARLSACL